MRIKFMSGYDRFMDLVNIIKDSGKISKNVRREAINVKNRLLTQPEKDILVKQKDKK